MLHFLGLCDCRTFPCTSIYISQNTVPQNTSFQNAGELKSKTCLFCLFVSEILLLRFDSGSCLPHKINLVNVSMFQKSFLNTGATYTLKI